MSNTPFSKILVYLDGSEGSVSALMYSIMLAKSTGSELHAVYVVNTKALGDLVKSRIFINEEQNEYLTDLKEDAKRHIKHALKLSASKDIDVETAILEGSPHSEISSYIKVNNIDLLVICSLNVIRSRREELLSENDRMLRTSECPVLVVKDNDEIWNEFEEF